MGRVERSRFGAAREAAEATTAAAVVHNNDVGLAQIPTTVRDPTVAVKGEPRDDDKQMLPPKNNYQVGGGSASGDTTTNNGTCGVATNDGTICATTPASDTGTNKHKMPTVTLVRITRPRAPTQMNK